ncbi:MAG: endo-1,4-beta-xylanase [Phycisphaerae bacterium]|nr:endo-1,4-beta-xylanase [Phycisphaerae bacterium]
MKTLKDAYKEFFTVGAAIEPWHLDSHYDLLTTQFNSLTCENRMKPCHMNPSPGVYTPEPARRIVDFAKAHGMAMRGHTLVWHHQTPPHMIDPPADRDTMLGRMRAHMFTMAELFGDVPKWDVVNEAVGDGDDVLRPSPWHDAIGPDYLDHAFRFAAEAMPPGTGLFYNDYGDHVPQKRDRICAMIRGMQDRGVPITGVGLQSHWGLDVNLDDVRRGLECYAKLGVEIHITEMDIGVLSADDTTRRDAPTEEMMTKLADIYAEAFAIFRQYKGILTNVTTWGSADDTTWLDHWPIPGRKNWPLLFDEHHQPKEAFWRVVEF